MLELRYAWPFLVFIASFLFTFLDIFKVGEPVTRILAWTCLIAAFPCCLIRDHLVSRDHDT